MQTCTFLIFFSCDTSMVIHRTIEVVLYKCSQTIYEVESRCTQDAALASFQVFHEYVQHFLYLQSLTVKFLFERDKLQYVYKFCVSFGTHETRRPNVYWYVQRPKITKIFRSRSQKGNPDGKNVDRSGLCVICWCKCKASF